MKLPLDRRPVVIAIAGPNGAGKTTFYSSHLHSAGLRFINEDVLASELNADSLRRQFVAQRESFVFETVFSDPAGDKLAFLMQANDAGYNTILCFIGISGSDVSEQRVAMRISMANLRSALTQLPNVWVFDNDDLRKPFRFVAVFENGVMRSP